MSTLVLPREGTIARAIIRRIYRAESIRRCDLKKAMVTWGMSDRQVTKALHKLLVSEQVIEVDHMLKLAHSICKHLDDIADPDQPSKGEVVPPREVRSTGPLLAKNIPFENSLLKGRLREWHPVPCASRPDGLVG